VINLIFTFALVFAFGFVTGYTTGLLVPKKIPKEKGEKTDGHTYHGKHYNNGREFAFGTWNSNVLGAQST
jgi:hypothetical protein